MLQDHHFEQQLRLLAAVVVKTCRLTSLCGVNDNRWYHKKKRNSEGWRLKNIFGGRGKRRLIIKTEQSHHCSIEEHLSNVNMRHADLFNSFLTEIIF